MDNFILFGIVLITFILAILLIKISLIRLLGDLLEGKVVGLKKSGKDVYPVVEFIYNNEKKSVVQTFSVRFKNKKYKLNETVKLYYWSGFSRNIYIKGEDTLLVLFLLFLITVWCVVFFQSSSFIL